MAGNLANAVSKFHSNIMVLKACLTSLLGEKYSSTFLPQVPTEQGWDQEKTIAKLLRKAGFKGKLEEVKESLKCEIYESTKESVNYLDYLNFVNEHENVFEEAESSSEDEAIPDEIPKKDDQKAEA